MVYHPGVLRKESQALVRARTYGVNLTSAFLASGLGASEVYRLRHQLAEPDTLSYFLLFLAVALLVFLWRWATEHELELLWKWLDPKRYAPPGSFLETVIIVGLALVLIGMLFAARNPLLFGGVFTIYNAATLLSGLYLNREILDALRESRQKINDDLGQDSLKSAAEIYQQALDVIDRYFLRLPQGRRHAIILLVGLAGMTFSIVWAQTNNPLWRLLAYLIYVLDILVSEVIIASWRIDRDRRLRTITVALGEVLPDRGETRSG